MIWLNIIPQTLYDNNNNHHNYYNDNNHNNEVIIMSKINLILTLMVCILLIAPVYAENSELNTNSTINPNEIINIPVIIVFKDNTGMEQSHVQSQSRVQSHVKDIIQEKGGDVKHNFNIINGVAAEIPETALEAISKNENVAFIELDTEVYALSQEISWGVDLVNAPAVHPYSKGKGIKIAIVDTGIDYTHPDINDNYKGGYDFVNSDNDPMDDHGHGTKVAGIIAGEDNDFGVLGVAPEASIYGLKVLGSNGIGSSSKVIKAIEWAVQNDIDIISMSLGGRYSSYAYEQALNNAYNSGVLVVAAAGNYGSDSPDTVAYPAKYDSVIAVSATRDSNLASFSSVGPAVELAAPGYYVMTTYLDGRYKGFYGTSAAAPFVSGVAALMMASDPTLTNSEIREQLQQNAVDQGVPGRDSKFGYGLVKAIVPTQKTLNVDVIAEADVVVSEQSTQITIHVESDGIPVPNAAVIVSTNGGSLNPSTGFTDANGEFTSAYTAPSVTSEKQYIISTTVTKDGFTAEHDSKTINVHPTPVIPLLETKLIAISQTLVSGERTQVTVKVSSNGAPVSNAAVDVSTSEGGLIPTKGVTDANGNFLTSYTAPQVSVRTQFTISAKVSMDGYMDGLGSSIVTVNPVNQGDPTDLPESPHPYPNSYDKAWTVTEPGAEQLRIHFSSLKTEARYDFVYIYDKNNIQIAKYNGYYNDIWTPWIEGDTIKVRLKTDGSSIRDGFIVDQKEVIYSSNNLVTTLSANSGIIESGKNIGVTIHITSGGLPVSGATIDVSTSGGNLNPTSGVTDNNGDFTATYTALQVTAQKQYTISAAASKSGYTSGSSSFLITVNPENQVNIPQLETAITFGLDVVESGKNTKATIHVSSNGAPVSGADVIISASRGNLVPLGGTTDVNGNFITTYTAPQVTTQTQITISATVSKSGFTSGSDSFFITVNPAEPVNIPQLEATITSGSEVVQSSQSTQATIYVSSYGVPISGANVIISTSNGNLDSLSGTTDVNGNFIATYTAPHVTMRTQVTISATVSKSGYSTESCSTIVTITPQNPGTSTFPESPHPYPNFYDNTWTITEPSAEQIRIHFSDLKTEARYDFVYIYDGKGVQIARYDGYHENLWTPWVDGDTIKVRLKTDGSGIRNGFTVDRKETRNV